MALQSKPTTISTTSSSSAASSPSHLLLHGNEGFDWRRVAVAVGLDTLDMVFLGWLAAALIVVAAVNLYIRYFGHRKTTTAATTTATTGSAATVGAGQQVQQQQQGDAGKASWRLWQNGSATTSGGGARSESCFWLNDAALWLFAHGRYSNDLEERLLRALNHRAAQQSQQDYYVKFERIYCDKNAFKFAHVATTQASEDTFTLHAAVECSKVFIAVGSANQPESRFQLSNNFEVELVRLNGTLKIICQSSFEGVETSLSFTSLPDMQLNVKSKSMQSDADKKKIENTVRECIASMQMTVLVSAYGGHQQLIQEERLFALAMQGQQGQKIARDKTLLVKVIKANGLGDKDLSVVNPYCVILLDQPSQKHVTAIIRNTVNPFWDEHFLLTLDDASRQIKFEVYHSENPGSGTTDELLGRASVIVAEVQRSQSSRQIVPLTGRPGVKTTSGSITVECLFLDQVEVPPRVLTLADSATHSRRISDSRQTAYDASGRPVSMSSNQLSAHEGALLSTQAAAMQHSPGQGQGTRGGVAPTVTVSSPGTDVTDNNAASAARDGKKQKTSFADTLRKKFGRPKKRSQSADRFASSSMREGSLLKPPEQQTGTDRAITVSSERLARKERSGSFGSSFKKLFGGKKKKDGSVSVSRETSVTRGQPADATGLQPGSAGYHDNQQHLGQGQGDHSSDPYNQNPYYYQQQDQSNKHYNGTDQAQSQGQYAYDDQQYNDDGNTARGRDMNPRGRQYDDSSATGGYAYSTSVPASNAQHLHSY